MFLLQSNLVISNFFHSKSSIPRTFTPVPRISYLNNVEKSCLTRIFSWITRSFEFYKYIRICIKFPSFIYKGHYSLVINVIVTDKLITLFLFICTYITHLFKITYSYIHINT